jgi:plastocyanin
MKIKNFLLLLAFVCLAMSLVAQAVNTKTTTNTNQQKPPITTIRCPDLKVLYFTVALVSTTVGPGVEFPRDTVLLTAEVGNVGTLPIPAGATWRITFYKNQIFVPLNEDNSSHEFTQNSLGKYKFKDSFPHGANMTYKVIVESSFRYQECSFANNSLSLTIDEGQLHAVKRLYPRR